VHIKSDHLKESIFKCSYGDECNYSAITRARLQRHLTDEHEVKKVYHWYQCGINGCTYSTQYSHNLPSHKHRKHGMEYSSRARFPCHFIACEASFFSSQELRAHFSNFHDIKMHFTCSHDGCSFTTYAQHILNDHINERHTHRVMYHCNVTDCTFTSYSKKRLGVHRWIKHKPKSL